MPRNRTSARQLLAVIFLCAMIWPAGRPLRAELPAFPDPPHLVVETGSEAVILQHRPFDRWAPASLTKLMTAYTVFRALELQHLAMNSPVRISEYALSQPPSKMGFPVGIVLTIETALKIILVKSANDVSVALAEAVGGSEEGFVRLMNSHARRLGMRDTSFVNPHGLHDPEQFTNARDMAVLGLAIAREFPQFDDFFDIPAIRITGRRLRNHNALLRVYEGTRGMKTGYVCASGFNVVVRTTRDSLDLITVVLGGKSALERNVRAARLLTESFGKPSDPVMEKLHSMERPGSVSPTPFDMTNRTCPGKYAAQSLPVDRPSEAPKSDDFDAVDTIVAETEKGRAETGNIPIPQVRPEFFAGTQNRPLAESEQVPTPSSDGPAASDEAVEGQQTEQETPPTLKELSKIYFEPASNLREDVVLSLGGATGPNPFGIRHTDGGVYVPPIPVPQKRPALDLKEAEE